MKPLSWINNGDAEEALDTPGWRILVTPVGEISDDQNWAHIWSADGSVAISGPEHTMSVEQAKRWCELVWHSHACDVLSAIVPKLAEALK